MLEIVEAKTRKQIRAFVDFPNKLYRDNIYYVPDMIDSQMDDLIPGKNPAFEYCECRCFLCLRDGTIVGRICGIINSHANEKAGVNYMRLSAFDFIDDDEVVDLLLRTLEDYAREKGCTAIQGPLGFSDIDREGMLIEGFDRLSQFFVYYNYPYYVRHMEKRGFVKQIDWLEFLIHIPSQVPPRLEQIAARVRERQHLTIADLSSPQRLPQYIRDFFKLYNEAYQVLFGMVPLTPKQVDKYVHEFRPLINGNTSAFVYNDKGEMVGFGVAAPSLSLANQRSHGRMMPLGWLYSLKALYGRNDRLDLFLIAVKPELKGRGINAVIIEHLLHKAIQNGIRYAETGPNLETNADVMSAWKFFEVDQHIKRRCWVKQLDCEEGCQNAAESV